MNLTKRYLFTLLSVVILALLISMYPLPYYIYKPGSADGLDPVVEVEDGYDSAGEMHLVTVSGGQATPIQYLWAKILPHHDIMPLEDVKPKGVTDAAYMHAQLAMMDSSQQKAIVVAYTAADKEIKVKYNGVYILTVVKDMPADGVLEIGDRITEIDGIKIKEDKDLIKYITTKKAEDKIMIKLIRDEKEMDTSVVLKKFSNASDKVGIGIELMTDRSVEVDPEVHFKSGNIGGPSAGLMFSLDIYDQLVKEDLTKGYQVVGTGEIDYDGNVLPIGGIDKKIIAAHKEGCDIFFAPNQNGVKDSNYQVAKKTAEEIGTSMKVIPIDTFSEAVEYLHELKPKK